MCVCVCKFYVCAHVLLPSCRLRRSSSLGGARIGGGGGVIKLSGSCQNPKSLVDRRLYLQLRKDQQQNISAKLVPDPATTKSFWFGVQPLSKVRTESILTQGVDASISPI